MKQKLWGLLIFIFGFAMSFSIAPVFASGLDPVTSVLGVDLTQSLLAGGSAAMTTIASLLVIFRKVKGQVSTLGVNADAFLANMKDKLDKVVKGEITLTQFVSDSQTVIADMSKVFTNAIAALRAENGALKDEITLIKEQFPIFVQLAKDIKETEQNTTKMLQIGFGNLKELVANGYAKEISLIGKVTDDESKG